MAVRLAHFSDVHLTDRPLGWRSRDLFSKKVLGFLNVKLLGRGYRFRHAVRVADKMLEEIRAVGFDSIVFSGDATKLAFDIEFEHAARRLAVNDLPGVAVPGNHDYYTTGCIRAGRFERHFAPWLAGQRIHEDEVYPFARKVGHVWLLCVNSSHPLRINLGAGAKIGARQLERLRALCASLDPGPRILVTHYPLRTAKGRIEPRSHRLSDHKASLEAARECGIGLWLHGHIHTGFVLPASPSIPFPTICAGSATQTNRWMYNQYIIDGSRLLMTRRVFDPVTQRFMDSDRYEMLIEGPDYTIT